MSEVRDRLEKVREDAAVLSGVDTLGAEVLYNALAAISAYERERAAATAWEFLARAYELQRGNLWALFLSDNSDLVEKLKTKLEEVE